MLLFTLAVCLLAACSDAAAPEPGPPPAPGDGARLAQVASGLSSPVHLTAPDGDNRLFIVEQPGRIRIVIDGSLLDAAFLDITGKVGSGGERGLLSVAFHPRYAENGLFFVNFTETGGTTRIERYRATPGTGVADPASAKLILRIEQPFGNHNGGHILFGPDGMLYIAMGDGGSGGDPRGNGQDRSTLLGALLRIDIDGGDPYSIPAGNPFINTAGARPEIWAYGLRNPWRIAFDREAGTLYIADVGQNRWEEINAVAVGAAGLNYGWNIMEGAHCFNASSCQRDGLTLPVLEYEHPGGCSVTGGLVYRGEALPDLRGTYFYADFCRGWVRSFRFQGESVSDEQEWDFGDVGNITSFGEDGAGEMYVLSNNGSVYRLVADEG